MALHGAPQLLTLGDVCAALAVSRSTARRMVKRGDLQPIRIGGLTRFRPADLEALIERYATSKVERPAGELASDTATLDDDERRDPA